MKKILVMAMAFMLVLSLNSTFYHLWVDDDNNHWEELPDAHEKLILARVN